MTEPVEHMPTPEHVLFQVQTIALLKVLGKKKAQPFLRAMATELAARQSYAEATPIRAPKNYPAKRDATREAADVFRRDLPTFLAAIPY
jgi:hypothetical protein